MQDTLQKKIDSKKAVVGIIGLGYIGLSLAKIIGEAGFSLLGFDIDEIKVQKLKKYKSYYSYLSFDLIFEMIKKKKFKVASTPNLLKDADVLIICVPTSLDKYQNPNLEPLQAAFKTVSSFLKKNLLIIVQSTTYPGTTKEDFLPLLEKSKFKVGKDYFLGYVPEISDPGNEKYVFNSIPRIVSGITPSCLEMVELLYKKLNCQLVPCSSTQVAEAAKILQNCYRLVNISLINEMKIVFDRMGIDIWEVIKVASSKPFGFTAFFPSAGIGGDCIPVDPHYLMWKAKALDSHMTLLDDAAMVNEEAPNFIVSKIIEGLDLHKKSLNGAKILVLGVGYKKDTSEIRQSAALKILYLLKKMLAHVSYNDPYVGELPLLSKYPDLHMKSVKLDYKTISKYDAVVIVTDHSIYDWNKIVKNSQLVIDTRNVTANIPGAKKKVIKA